MNWNTVLAIATPLLTALVGGLVGLMTIWMSRIQTKEKARIAKAQALDDIKIMRENSRLAVQATEQLAKASKEQTGKELSGEEKKNMALGFAQTWNKMAGVNVLASAVIPINEANVLLLPKTEPVTPIVVGTDLCEPVG